MECIELEQKSKEFDYKKFIKKSNKTLLIRIIDSLLNDIKQIDLREIQDITDDEERKEALETGHYQSWLNILEDIDKQGIRK